jgi:hypothetical protein
MASDAERRVSRERLAREWLATIERCAVDALSPAQSPAEGHDLTKRAAKNKRAQARSRARDDIPPDDAFDAMSIGGIRTMVVENREKLNFARKTLRPAFDGLVMRLLRPASTAEPEDSDFVYQRLEELIQAAFWIGAYATVTDGTKDYFKPALSSDQAQAARNALAERIAQSGQRDWLITEIKSAIAACEREGKRVTGKEVAWRINQSFKALPEPKAFTLPSDRTTVRALQEVRGPVRQARRPKE